MKRLADQAGVSLSTVSHLLNRTRTVSAPVRQAVIKAAADIGFEDPRLTRLISADRVIGVVVPSVGSPNLIELFDGLGVEAQRLAVTPILMSSGEDPQLERHCIACLAERDIQGLILIPTGGWREHSAALLRSLDLPVVIVDRVDEDRWDQIGSENVRASQALVGHLLQIGHRRIGILRGLAERLVVDGLSTARGGQQAMRRLMELSARPTAVFCSNNAMTAGALATVRRLKLEVPGELAIVAFDDLDWSTIIAPEITSMAQPFHAIGGRALQMLLARMADPAAAPSTIRLPPSFEHRRSCGCPTADPVPG